MTKWLQSKALSTFLLVILSESLRDIKCRGDAISDVTYDELMLLKAACDKSGYSCNVTNIDNQFPSDFNCNCGSACSFLGTCCVDSQYRYNEPKLPENAFCEKHYDKTYSHTYSYLMIRSCDPNLESDKTTVELCNSDGEDLNDPFLKIPVTDPITGISYKNSYCYACNVEYSKEEPMQWDLQIESYDKEVTKSIDNIRYDNRNFRWVINNGEEVHFIFHVPEKLKSKVYQQHCETSKIIWGCASDWNDYENILNKCWTYMALTRIQSETYRNPHCAICNHRSLENKTCYDDSKQPGGGSLGVGGGVGGRIFFVGWFSFNDNCEDNMIYDAFAKKCRRVFRFKRKVQ